MAHRNNSIGGCKACRARKRRAADLRFASEQAQGQVRAVLRGVFSSLAAKGFGACVAEGEGSCGEGVREPRKMAEKVSERTSAEKPGPFGTGFAIFAKSCHILRRNA